MSSSKAGGRTLNDVVQAVNVLASTRHPRLNHMVNTKELLEYMGLTPQLSKMRLIHVAGTKGKGTTSWYTSNFLQCYGHRVGLFTSPHLTDVRERILVNNQKLSEVQFTQYFFEVLDRIEEIKRSEDSAIRAKAEGMGLFSFFFLLCVHIFLAERVEVAVLETGIGGRFDTTNSIHAEVSVITALGFDHMSVLGDTIEAIAGQKAGIIKPNSVCFSFSQKDYPETRTILSEEAKRVGGTEIYFFDRANFPLAAQWPPLAIGGEHIVENSMVALQVARHVSKVDQGAALSDAELHVLRDLTFDGRSQIVRWPPTPTPTASPRTPQEMARIGTTTTFYLDGAHTPESLAYATKWFINESERRCNGAGVTPFRGLLFYSSRSPRSILRSFRPYAALFQKVVIAQVYNPKPSAEAPPVDDLEAWKQYATEVMESTRGAWHDLYPEHSDRCVGMSKRLESLDDVLPFFKDVSCTEMSAGASVCEPHVLVCGSFFLLADFLHAVEKAKE